MATLQGDFSFDSDLFEFVAAQGWADFSDMQFNLAKVVEGILGFSWFDPTFNGVTLADDSRFFRVCLKAKGATGDSSLAKIGAFEQSLRAEDANGNLIALNSRSGLLTISDASKIDEKTAETPRFWPNPAADEFFIEGASASFFQIFDARGKAVLIAERSPIRLEGLAEGVYFLKILDKKTGAARGSAFLKN